MKCNVHVFYHRMLALVFASFFAISHRFNSFKLANIGRRSFRFAVAEQHEKTDLNAHSR